MYHNRVKMDPNQGRCFYFVTNRITGCQRLLGDREKNKFCELLFEGENRHAYRVWDFVALDSHWHMLIEVRQAAEMPRAEVLRRWQATQRRIDPGDPGDAALAAFRQHIHDISFCVGNIEQRFSEWYNKSHERWGKLVGGRFHAVIVHEEMVALVMAYLTLNPIRAGIVAEPAEYRWCGYAWRVANNKLRAEDAVLAPLMRKLLCLSAETLEQIENGDLQKMWDCFRAFFLAKPINKSGRDRRTVGEYVAARGGDDPSQTGWNARLLTKARFATQGVAIGPPEFIQEVLDTCGQSLGYKRAHTPQDSGSWPGVYCLKRHRLK